MKQFIHSFLSAIGLASSSERAAEPPDVFTADFAGALKRALPAHSVTTLGTLRLSVKGATGEGSTAYLENAYTEYSRDPKAKFHVIDRYVASLAESVRPRTGVDASRIVPVVKDRNWIEEMRRAAEQGGSPLVDQIVWDDLNGDLVIVYAEDTERNTRYIPADELNKAGEGVGRDQLRRLAEANLRRILPEPKIHRGPQVSMLTAGADYVASLLLLDELWSPEKLGVPGDVVVAIPSRDVLLFAGTGSPGAVMELRQVARKALAEGSYPLTDKLFVRRGGAFQRLSD